MVGRRLSALFSECKITFLMFLDNYSPFIRIFVKPNDNYGMNTASTLHTGDSLQGGKYRIQKVLGQGGFGITYLAIQSGLDRQVAVKEFFMREYCERDEGSSRITLGTEGSRETVNGYRKKFLKEARNIARLNHPHIVRIIDVFEENGTAYYVMEYIAGGSLADLVRREGALPEDVATRYISQVAAALDYVHGQRMTHLDIKPANIMLDEKGEAVIIDFGLAKQYDATTGNQTSSTPVGISEGYAPLEQYMQGGVGEFAPEADVYALGATFYKLLTGITPPSASVVNNEGQPLESLQAMGVSKPVIATIAKAMEGRRKDRTKTIADFVSMLGETSEQSDESLKNPVSDEEDTADSQTIIRKKPAPSPPPSPKPVRPWRSLPWKKIAAGAAALLVLVMVGVGVLIGIRRMGATSADVAKTGKTPKSIVGQQEWFTVGNVNFHMINIEGGTFTMGCTSEMDSTNYSFRDEKPVHRVYLDSYAISTHEVSQDLWQAVMGSNPSTDKGMFSPVENVSWDDCQEFIQKLNALTDGHFRLPTEAEWEYACRGGRISKGYRYSGSNNIGEVARYAGNSRGLGLTCSKKENELGLYDMSGSVWEWCSDWYGPYTADDQDNPKGPQAGDRRVARGGSFGDDAVNCRSSARMGLAPDNRFTNVGFRLARSL